MPRRRPSVSGWVADSIRQAVLDGQHTIYEPLPSFRDLSCEYGVSVNAVKSALDTLEAEGIVYRRERRGTFVRGTGQPIRLGEEPTLKCLVLVERPLGTLPGFLRADYFAGYASALEHCTTRMRVTKCPADEDDYVLLFSREHPLQEQGCVLINLVNPALLQWLKDRNVPCVVQNHITYDKAGLPAHHSVCVNKIGGGFAAARHLLDLGHRRIGFMGLVERPDWGSGMFSAVYEGYRSALRCAGLEALPAYTMRFSTDEPHNAVGPAREFLSRSDLPTAIVADTDATAMGILAAARSLGIQVPERLSVTGQNDQDDAQTTEPPLTTAHYPFVVHGRTAVEMLFAAAAGRLAGPQSRVLECRLAERKSTAPPKEGGSADRGC